MAKHIFSSVEPARSDQLSDQINAALGTKLDVGDIINYEQPDGSWEVQINVDKEREELVPVLQAYVRDEVYSDIDKLEVKRGAIQEWLAASPGVISFLQKEPLEIVDTINLMAVAELRTVVAQMAAIVSVLVKREFPDKF